MVQPSLSKAVCRGMVPAIVPRRADRAPGGAGPVRGLPGGSGPTGRLSRTARSVVGQDRADAAALGEERIAAVAEQVEVEVLVGLLLAVPLHLDRDRLRRLAWGEGQCAGPGEIV